MDDLGDDAAANSKDISDNAAKVGQGAAEVGKGAADATKNAMDAVAKLPTARMMSGRERCANAPNGAPDCLAAAEALCRKHGFASGKSMDFTSAEECPAKTLLGPDRGMHDRDLHQPRDVPVGRIQRRAIPVPRTTAICVRLPVMPKSSSLISASAPSPSSVMPSVLPTISR